jgi:hypothetical protein
MISLQIIQLPLSRLDDIARALKTGWTYVARDQNVVTLKKEEKN